MLIKNTIYSHTTVYTYSLSINFFSDIFIISRVDRSGPYKMNRRTIVDSIITIGFNRWTGGPSYKGKVSSSAVLIKGSMFYLYLTSH